MIAMLFALAAVAFSGCLMDNPIGGPRTEIQIMHAPTCNGDKTVCDVAFGENDELGHRKYD